MTEQTPIPPPLPTESPPTEHTPVPPSLPTESPPTEPPPRRRWRRVPRPSWPRLIVALFLVGALVLGLVVLNSPLLEVNSVRVGGAETVSPQAIAQLTGLQGQNILRVDLEAARQRIVNQPMIHNASVSRSWPNRIEVVIVERRPWGRWRAENIVWPIDAEGVILEGVAPPADGPVVRQVSALPALRAGARVDTTAVQLVAQIHERGAPVDLPGIVSYEWAQSTGLTVVTQHGEIVFGDVEGFEFKYDVWSQLEQEARSRGEPLIFADLRFGLRPRVEIGLNVGRAVRIDQSERNNRGR